MPVETAQTEKLFDPVKFDRMAEEVFKPCYSMIAQQIIRRTGIDQGLCADVGSGGGHLGVALQCMAKFRMTFVDILGESIELAKERTAALGLAERSDFVVADADALPFKENSFDLIVSRGSLWFWKDPAAVLSSMYSMLKPGGSVYVGGGFGNAAISEEIHRTMEARESGWTARRDEMTKASEPAAYRKILGKMPCDDSELYEGGREFWLRLTKRARPLPPPVDFLGYAYCPVKQLFSDLCGKVLDGISESTGRAITSSLPAGCNLEDSWDGLHREKNIDAFPTMIASVSYGDFFADAFRRNHADAGRFGARSPAVVASCFRRREVIDPEGVYGIYAVCPLVMLVEPDLLEGRPLPRTLMDLCKSEYRGLICMSSSHGDVHDDSLAQLAQDGGIDAVKLFALNVERSLHGAEIARRAGTDHPGRSAISLVTWFFARSCPRKDRVVVVFPEDGAPSTPFYYTAKKNGSEKLGPLIELLEGQTLGQAFADQGFPAVNPLMDNHLPPDAWLRLPGWDFLRAAPPEESRATLVATFYEAWWASHPGRRNPCDS
jgi:SAM-dependent methyltransferase